MTFNDVTPVAGEGVKMTWVGIKITKMLLPLTRISYLTY